MKLETSEEERAELTAWCTMKTEECKNGVAPRLDQIVCAGTARLLRDIDTLLAERVEHEASMAEIARLRAELDRAPPLPAEVEEMRGRILVALLHAAIRASNDEGHKMAAYFDSVRDDAASLLSRWPGRWRGIETAPKDGMAFLICDARTGSYNVVSYVDVGSDYCWEIVDSSVRLHAEWGTHWSPLPEPPHE